MRAGPVLRLVLGNAAVLLGLLLILEGLASGVLLIADLRRPKEGILAERLHTRYDPELGWSNLQGQRLPDLYGPGRPVTINAQGFRGRRDTATAKTPGAFRLACSGDSFTFGYGVGDDDTWCEQLARRWPGAEPINLGLGGYGIDQSYLRYRRDGVALQLDLHLFAFIREDFFRALSSEFLGHGKPLLRVEEGGLQVTNVPVPPPGQLRGGLGALRQLRVVQLTSRLLSSRRLWREPTEPGPLAQRILAAVQALDAERGRPLVFVYLPTEEDVRPGPGDAFRGRLRQLAEMGGWSLVDLTEELRQLQPGAVTGLFLPADALPEFLGAAGHYTEAGNAFVAEALQRRLLRIPAVAARLQAVPPAAARR